MPISPSQLLKVLSVRRRIVDGIIEDAANIAEGLIVVKKVNIEVDRKDDVKQYSRARGFQVDC